MSRILIIPNDPIYKYVTKGVLKERYFNPGNLFDEVHIMSLAERDDALEAARVLAGDARVEIHPVGRPGFGSWPAVRARALELARRLKPDAVRGYNPLLMGYLTVICARAAEAVSVVSVHDDYSISRSLSIYGPRFLLTGRGIYQSLHHVLGYNRTTLLGADHIICAYRFPLRYVNRWRAEGVSVIYNRVYLERFHPSQRQESPVEGRLRVLNVGRQFEGKDPAPIVEAVARDERLELTLVGHGPFHERLKAQAARLRAGERITFIPRVFHAELPELYRAHDIFAMAITQPGVCIPVLEASATGLPIVINRPRWEPEPEVVGHLAEVVSPDAAGYAAAFERLIRDPAYRKARGAALREKVHDYGGESTERAERELYERLLAGKAGSPR